MIIRKTVEESKFGLMAVDMMGSGEMEWLMGMGAWFMRRVMFMKENGLTIKQMALVSTLTLMAADMKVNGISINNTALALNNGRMVLNMKAIMSKE
jgi:hypothetical protein